MGDGHYTTMYAWAVGLLLLLDWIIVGGTAMAGIGVGLVNNPAGLTLETATGPLAPDVLPPGTMVTPPISSKFIAQNLGGPLII